LKRTFSLIAVVALAALALAPPVSGALDASMPRKALAEPAALLFLGAVAGWLSPGRPSAFLAPAGVAAGSALVVFWMIPRSIDETQIVPAASGLYAVCLFLSGALLSKCLPLLPRVARTAYALYVASMLVAVGLLYASQSTLWCSAYTIDDQHAFGRALTVVGGVLYVLVLAAIPGWLRQPNAAAGAEPSPGHRR